jgi:acetyltransferase-like isoleucine patch superfamily enzyme
MENKVWRKELSNHQEFKIGKNCVIHSHTWIGKDVIIGSNVKIESFVFVPDGVRIKDNVFVGPGVVFTNDKYPPSGDKTKWLPTLVKDGASIGANVTIVCGVTIGKRSMIGAGSVVTKNVPDGEVWAGNPAKKLRNNYDEKN